MADKIYFSIPSFTYLKKLNLYILDLKQKYPEKFNDDVVIESVYGNYPLAIWNGGRLNYNYADPFPRKIRDEIRNTTNIFNSYNVSIRYTFTNLLIEEKHLSDTYCNMIIENTVSPYNVQNGCTVASPILREYLKEQYPHLYLVHSTTLEDSNIDSINQKSNDQMLVLPFSVNNQFDLLQQLKNPHNIEVLAAEESCIDNCPNRKQHYHEISAFNLHQIDDVEIDCPRLKIAAHGYYYQTISSVKSYVSLDTIRDKYLPLGINHFKISGRSESTKILINTIENYVNYFIKPEYQNDMRNQILINVFCNLYVNTGKGRNYQ